MENTLTQLIEALTIFNKYIPDLKWPTGCGHDTLYIRCDPSDVSGEDIKRLDELGFVVSDEDCFCSYDFGS